MTYGFAYHIETSEGGVILWNDSTGKIVLIGRKILWQKLEKEWAKRIEKKSKPFSPKTASNVLKSSSPKIFIVHGHDSAALEQLELTLRRLELEPYILQNTSGNGSTIIEALEKEICTPTRSIKFGIVLLTPDDIGYSKIDGQEQAKPRARQNVILEMGMFMAVLPS